MARAAISAFGLGFVIALTPGPMFFLCLRRTLTAGRSAGFATGLGIATADGIYAAVAAGGIGGLSALLAGSSRWLTLAGGIGLVVLGVVRLLPTRWGDGRAAAGGARGAYASALALTLANPATIVSFGALFAAVGLASPIVVPAVVAGSLSWWLLLVGIVSALRSSVGARPSRALALLSGCALVAFGVVAVGSGLVR